MGLARIIDRYLVRTGSFATSMRERSAQNEGSAAHSEDSIDEPFSKWNIESLGRAPSQVLTFGDARGQKSAPAAEQSKPVEPPPAAAMAATFNERCSEMDLDREIAYAAQRAGRVLAALVGRHESIFPRRMEPWYQATDEDSPDKVATLVLLSLAI
jgi:hypothetical protein